MARLLSECRFWISSEGSHRISFVGKWPDERTRSKSFSSFIIFSPSYSYSRYVQYVRTITVPGTVRNVVVRTGYYCNAVGRILKLCSSSTHAVFSFTNLRLFWSAGRTNGPKALIRILFTFFTIYHSIIVSLSSSSVNAEIKIVLHQRHNLLFTTGTGLSLLQDDTDIYLNFDRGAFLLWRLLFCLTLSRRSHVGKRRHLQCQNERFREASGGWKGLRRG